MAPNNDLFKKRNIQDRILFKRGNHHQEVISTINKTDNEKKGVLVIDPNRVVDDFGHVSDRYIKQEDLVIYSSLKVFKKPELAIINDNGKSSVSPNNIPIQINFLNPLKTKATVNDKATYKGKLTNQWTDFFTSDAANNKTTDSYVLDPETFGISGIDININANLLPRITMKFIDVQGRMLFERGNDPDNPYNIFFTYPYPKFLLTYKGYYGKAIELPLVLFKTNSRFDAQTGNYEITAEFQAEIFSMMNNFLIIYAYAAPYMFLMKDGTYLGQQILSNLYETQNKELELLLSNDPDEIVALLPTRTFLPIRNEGFLGVLWDALIQTPSPMHEPSPIKTEPIRIIWTPEPNETCG